MLAVALDYLRDNAIEFEGIEIRECVRINVALHALMTVNSLQMRKNLSRTVRKDMRTALPKRLHELGVRFALQNLVRSQVNSEVKFFCARNELLNPVFSGHMHFRIPAGQCCCEAK